METRSLGHAACCAAAVLMGLAATAAQAAPVTYNVNESVGTATVTGTIQTDGAIGILNRGDLLDWSLSLDDGTASILLTPANSGVFMRGAAVSADPVDLYFDYSNTSRAGEGWGDYLLFETALTGGANYWCNSAELTSLCLQGKTVTPGDFSTLQNLSAAGNQVIGVAAVAEPSELALIVTGLGVLGYSAGRRRQLVQIGTQN